MKILLLLFSVTVFGWYETGFNRPKKEKTLENKDTKSAASSASESSTIPAKAETSGQTSKFLRQ